MPVRPALHMCRYHSGSEFVCFTVSILATFVQNSLSIVLKSSQILHFGIQPVISTLESYSSGVSSYLTCHALSTWFEERFAEHQQWFGLR